MTRVHVSLCLVMASVSRQPLDMSFASPHPLRPTTHPSASYVPLTRHLPRPPPSSPPSPLTFPTPDQETDQKTFDILMKAPLLLSKEQDMLVEGLRAVSVRFGL